MDAYDPRTAPSVIDLTDAALSRGAQCCDRTELYRLVRTHRALCAECFVREHATP